mgnify:CR=1 FL=1
MFKPYVKTLIDIKWWLEIEKMMSNQLELSMSQFKTYFFYNLLFRQSGQFCYGFGWSSEPITLKLEFLLNFVDCYKNLITDLCKWDEVFINEDAMWMDSCTASLGSSLVKIQNWEISKFTGEKALLGGDSDTSTKGCW